jgi:ABC-type polysaccharide/polyol phosphate export permease
MANLFYRDVKYLFEVILMFWMFGSAIVYPLEAVGGTLGMLIRANPMTAIVEAYRSILLYGTVPDAALFLPAALGSAVALPLAWLVFHRSEFRFAESI